MACREQYRERIIETLDYIQGELHHLKDELNDTEYIARKHTPDVTPDELLSLQIAVLDAIKGLGALIDKLN